MRTRWWPAAAAATVAIVQISYLLFGLFKMFTQKAAHAGPRSCGILPFPCKWYQIEAIDDIPYVEYVDEGYMCTQDDTVSCPAPRNSRSPDSECETAGMSYEYCDEAVSKQLPFRPGAEGLKGTTAAVKRIWFTTGFKISHGQARKYCYPGCGLLYDKAPLYDKAEVIERLQSNSRTAPCGFSAQTDDILRRVQ